jgi:4'-phosphopantetheinyl transferase
VLEARTAEADPLELPESQAHLWVADHRVRPDELPAYLALLDAGERERASRFRFHKDYRRFVFGHGRLRMILGRYCAVAPERLVIARRCAVCGSDAHGKPFLVPPSGERSAIRFSCSYSDELVVVGVSNGAEVGVDVERVDDGFAWREVAETALSAGERSILDGAADVAAARAFYGIWTRKEAVSKVTGRGLSQLTEMDTCGWTPRTGGEFEVPAGVSGGPLVGKTLDLPGHEAAVAVEGAAAPEWLVKELPADALDRGA